MSTPAEDSDKTGAYTARGAAAALEAGGCAACRAMTDATEARRVAEDRRIDLALAAIRNSSGAVAYRNGHGLCLRHVVQVAPRDGTGIVAEKFSAMLDVADWEMREVFRRIDWRTRFERAGGEATAWRLVPALLDGHVYLGSPSIELC